jgi:hypothetical protein
MERGCVKDQPQQVKDSESLENSKALRLVEDDTAALRHFSNTLLDGPGARIQSSTSTAWCFFR